MSTIDSFEYTEYQGITSWYKHVGENNAPELTYLTLGLVGESGEFNELSTGMLVKSAAMAESLKKLTRNVGQDDPNAYWRAMNEGMRDIYIDELGDVLWYLNKLATFLNITIEDLMVLNTVKLHQRWGIPNNVEWPFSAITFEEAKGDVECPF